MDHPIIKLKETDSTNDYLETLLSEENLAEGTVVISDYQRMGKGMLQNSWQSETGKNLLFSILLKPLELHANRQFFLSKTISLAIHDMLADILNPESIHIKWPNDIVASSLKMGGTLIKCNLRNTSVQQAIVGIGLNINQTVFPENITATSILIETGRDSVLDQVLGELLKKIDFRIDQLNSKEFKKIDLDYRKWLLGFGKWIQFSRSGKIFDGKILNVGDDGRLKLENRDGTKSYYDVKEINLISTRPI